MAVSIAVLAAAVSISAQDKDSVKVPNGLAFSEFRGYEDWAVISISGNGGKIAVIVGNPAMIDADKAGVPDNGKPFPDGARMAKIHWSPKKEATYPEPPTVPDTLHDVDFRVKDSVAAQGFRPATVADRPPQENDAKCGLACHTLVKNRDYVFTEYAKR